MLSRNSPSVRRRQSGLSIVELMVGVAIGLVITAAATLIMSGQLIENRRLLTETQLQQDLRAATDIMAREMRRAGGSSEVMSLASIWFPGSPVVVNNQMAQLTRVVSPTAVVFDYFPGPFVGNPSTSLGLSQFSLQSTVIKTDIGGGAQDLTDGNVMRVTAFTPTVTTDSSAAIVLPCPNVCTGGGTACWPRFEVRRAHIDVEAEARRDATVKRAISSTVRLRNDRVLIPQPAPPAPPTIEMCPQ